MKFFPLLAMFIFAVSAAHAAAPATQPSPEAAARAAKLAATVKSFQLQLSYHGEQDKPYYDLLLSVAPVPVAGGNPFSPAVTVTPAEAEKIIARLSDDGFLDRAIDISNKRMRPPAAPCYTLLVRYTDGNDRPEFYERLGWELPLLVRLDGLRGVLGGDAAKAMDLLLGRLAGHRQEWERRHEREQASIAADITRLADAGGTVRAAAVTAMTKIGTPAAPALVRSLGDPANDIRAAAAEALRGVLAADPAGAPNFHDRAFWEKRIADVAVGTAVDDALRLLLPDATPEERKAALQEGAWSGQSGFSIVRLDDYWIVTLPLVDAGREKVGQPPVLKPSVRSVWVQPPEKYTGPWVTWFVNGQKAHEVQYRNGVYHGTFTAFHDDGSKSYEQHYRNGTCDGADTGWYRGGRKMYDARYKDGKQDGRWEHWFPDGKPQMLREYRDGVLDGVYRTWFESGQVRQEQHYRDGKQDGPDVCWDEQGKLLWSRTYRGGELVESK